jgi:hypothetical protein
MGLLEDSSQQQLRGCVLANIIGRLGKSAENSIGNRTIIFPAFHV